MEMKTQTFDQLVKSGKVRFRDYIIDAAMSGKEPNDEIFAESFDSVIKGRIDARDFFERTEFVQGLEDLVNQVLGRIFGKSTTSNFLLDTQMGGGKTHALAYIYFLFKEPSVAYQQSEIKKLLREFGQDELPDVDVVAVDGMNMKEDIGLKDQEAFKKFFARGGDKDSVLAELKRSSRPTVFMIDEIFNWLKRRGDYSADIEHLRVLMAAVSEAPNSVLIITIPADVGDREAHDRLVALFKATGRASNIKRTVSPEDITSIVKRQLFEHVDEGAAKVAEEYAQRVLGRMGLRTRFNYREAFPLHPALIDITGRRFSEFEGFQKTRGSLKVLARLAVDVYLKVQKGERFQTPFITPGDVDLGSSLLNSALTNYNTFGMQNLGNVVGHDIVPLENPAKGIAAAIYLYSLYPSGLREKPGVTVGELYEALLLPNTSTSNLEERVESYMKERSAYLWFDDSTKRYYFKTEQNIYTLINREAEKVPDDYVVISNSKSPLREEMQDLLRAFNQNEVLASVGKAEPQEGRLNLLVLPWEEVKGKVSGSPGEGVEEATDRANREVLAEWGCFEINSSRRNSVVVLGTLHSEAQEGIISDTAKRVVAVRDLKKSGIGPAALLSQEEEKTRVALRSLIAKYYTALYFAQENEVKREEITPMQQDAEGYCRAIREALRKALKAYLSEELDHVSMKAYFEALLGKRRKYRLGDAYRDVEDSTVVPFMPRTAFMTAVKMAVEEGAVGYSDSDPDAVDFTGNVYVGSPPLNVNDYGYLIEAQVAKSLAERAKRPSVAQPSIGSSAYAPPANASMKSNALDAEVVVRFEGPALQTISTPIIRLSVDGLNKLKRCVRAVELGAQGDEGDVTVEVYGEEGSKMSARLKLSSARKLNDVADALYKAFGDNCSIRIIVKAGQEDVNGIKGQDKENCFEGGT
ncbi:MAG: DUF499 domain-containing protein [Thermoprotei archaeon]